MKRFLLFLALAIVIASPQRAYSRSQGSCHDCDCSATSHTFFNVRPPFQLNSPESRSVFRNFMDAKEDGYHGAIQVVPYGGRMTKNDRMARYFLPDCVDTLRINEVQNDFPSAVASQQTANVYARQLGIITQNGTFESCITFEPEHRFAGVGFTLQQSIYEFCSGQDVWIRVLFPYEHVRNRIDLRETVMNDGGGVATDITAIPNVYPNATAAFTQRDWRFGRVPVCEQSESGVADVTLLLGYESVENECSYMHLYAGGIAPTGNRPTACYLFEPMVGHNGHGAFVFGSSMGMLMWQHECYDRALQFSLDISGGYFFERSERRFADLKNKPFSRYMYVFASEQDAQNNILTPGINLFTQEFKVKPGFERVINSAMIYESCWGFDAEVGYNFFARQEECVEIKCDFPSGVALAALDNAFDPNVQPDDIGSTDSVQLISNNFANANVILFNDQVLDAGYANNTLSIADFDLESVAHPCMLEHTFYGSLSYTGDCYCYPTFIGLGGSYKLSRGNTGMHAWMVWGKVGVAY